MTPEERRQKVKTFVADVDWDAYDYTRAPGADMRFPDLTPEQIASKDIWVSKHYNTTSSWSCVHVIDLNEIAEGAERRLFALYGLPVEWPKPSEDQDAHDELLDTLDDARARGGEAWREAMDSHGLLSDEHYLWVRGRKLGIPEKIKSWDGDRGTRAFAKIDAAIAKGEGVEDELEACGFRDVLHFQYVKEGFEKGRAKAWKKHDALLQSTLKGLDERLEKNKAALSNELAPVKGISMEDWAEANARLIQGTPLDSILAEMKIERPLWDEVNAEWNGRMARDTTATIATVYGQAFTNPRKKAGAAPAKSDDPLSFEDWVKIQSHMNAALAQGVDPNAVLARYKLNAADWGKIGGHWGLKMTTNMEYLQKYTTLSAQYAQQFAAGKAGADIEF